MTKMNVVRWVKGTLASAVAAGVSFWMWVRLREWAEGISAAGQGAMGTGWTEGVLASLIGVLSMPVLLWASMRLLGEKGNHVLVLCGVGLWWFIGGHVVEGSVGDVATAVFLALFAVAGGLLSLVEVPAQ
jgi:hypothetical protein